jgi:glucose/arabinose dehydrogenase
VNRCFRVAAVIACAACSAVALLLGGEQQLEVLPIGQPASQQVNAPDRLEYETVPTPFATGPAAVWAVAISPSGQLLASSAANGQVRLYDRATRELLQLVQCHQDSAASLAFSSDSSLLATAGYDRGVKIWRMPEFQL